MIYFFRKILPYAIIFIVVQSLLRASLLVRGMLEIEITFHDILQIFARGFWLDLATLPFVILPFAIFFFLKPPLKSFYLERFGGFCFRTIFIFLLLFDGVAEHLFWSEFNSRFNFIAVDYLIYTHEVIGNIRESYPVALILSVLVVIAAFFAYLQTKFADKNSQNIAANLKERSQGMALYAAFTAILFIFSNYSQAQYSKNAEAGEIAANGIYNLFYAFLNNEITYERFYALKDQKITSERTHELLAEENNIFSDNKDFMRIIKPKAAEIKKNVVVVVMESMSASYMQHFGNQEKLTPNLDELARNGLLFTNAYATGTRTVRGLEAVTLSIPPTPGQSIIRRKSNENLFSLGFIFQDRDYKTQFLYGGYGYFDNMNAFFAGNGFDVIDRTKISKDKIHFANVWGIADEDLFAHAVTEADQAFKAKKKFLQLIMTTSNHRPYSFPEGRIDLPSKSSGRNGGVKYSDFSIGKFIEAAKTKPWFDDTVFVFVADHTAGAAGAAELDAKKYHIPIIFYAPKFIAPQIYDKIMSQIDVAPILLGQLNFHYRSKFYGEDVLHDDDESPHAFISNYQKIALIKEDKITILAPKRKVTQLSWPEQNPLTNEDEALTEDAIAYYQSASWWKKIYKR
jgi:phosphoglycerol transferase MdoB-like AlkP superfamily enzyme